MSRIVPAWIDSTNKDAGEVLVTDGLGKAIWVPYVTQAGFGRAVYSGSYFTSASPYVEYSSTSWQVVNHFYYLGSGIVLPKEFIVIGSRSGATGTSECRLYDHTNSLEIALVSWTAADINTYLDDTLQNLPSGRSVLSVQIRKSAAGASKTRLHSFVLT